MPCVQQRQSTPDRHQCIAAPRCYPAHPQAPSQQLSPCAPSRARRFAHPKGMLKRASKAQPPILMAQPGQRRASQGIKGAATASATIPLQTRVPCHDAECASRRSGGICHLLDLTLRVPFDQNNDCLLPYGRQGFYDV